VDYLEKHEVQEHAICIKCMYLYGNFYNFCRDVRDLYDSKDIRQIRGTNFANILVMREHAI